MRDRAKSLEGGVLRPSYTQLQLDSRHMPHQDSTLRSRFRPPLDFSISNWLVPRLNRLRKKMKSKENARWMRVKNWAQRIVEHMYGRLCIPPPPPPPLFFSLSGSNFPPLLPSSLHPPELLNYGIREHPDRREGASHMSRTI